MVSQGQNLVLKETICVSGDESESAIEVGEGLVSRSGVDYRARPCIHCAHADVCIFGESERNQHGPQLHSLTDFFVEELELFKTSTSSNCNSFFN